MTHLEFCFHFVRSQQKSGELLYNYIGQHDTKDRHQRHYYHRRLYIQSQFANIEVRYFWLRFGALQPLLLELSEVSVAVFLNVFPSPLLCLARLALSLSCLLE